MMSGKKLTPVKAKASSQSVQMAESISVPRVEMADCVCIDQGIVSTGADSVMVPISKVEQYLQTHKECYERTWPVNATSPRGGKAKHLDWTGLSDRVLNRVYIDLDGEVPFNTTEQVFNKLVSDIEDGLRMAFADSPSSAMTACMWKCADNKGKVKNKLSFRVVLTHVYGDKDDIEAFVKLASWPMLSEQLAGVIPVSWGKDKINPYTLVLDTSVYDRGGRKMRMWGQSKPEPRLRKNQFIKDWPHPQDIVDTLIGYIPADAEAIVLTDEHKLAMAEPVCAEDAIECDDDAESIRTHSVVSDPKNQLDDEAKVRANIMKIVPLLNQSRVDYYPEWIRIGFVMFNSGSRVDDFIEVSKRSNKWQADSPNYIKKLWSGFKQSTLGESLLWQWLSEDAPEAFAEMSEGRNDFWALIRNYNQASTAQFFYNLKPSSYVYNRALGWFQVQPNGIWQKYSHDAPFGLATDIYRTFKSIIKRHFATLMAPTADEEKRKQNLSKQKALTRFEKDIGQSSFSKGLIKDYLIEFYNDPKLEDKMDENHDLFAFSDGTLWDFKLMKPRKIVPNDFICLTTGYEFPVAPDPVATKEVYGFLRGLFESEADIKATPTIGEMTDYVLRIIALCLQGTRSRDEFYIMTGSGGNGKGFLDALIKRVFGDYYHPWPAEVITRVSNSQNAHNGPVANARSKRYVAPAEPEPNDKFQVGIIKLYTGGNPITARDCGEKNGKPYTAQFGLFCQSNGKPKLARAEGGIQRRIKIWEFGFSFVDNPTEEHQKLKVVGLRESVGKNNKWRDALFWILIEAYKRTLVNGVIEPASVIEASKKYINENNPVADWVAQFMDTTFPTTDKAHRGYYTTAELVALFKYDMPDFPCPGQGAFCDGLRLLGVPRKGLGVAGEGLRWSKAEAKWVPHTYKATDYWRGIVPAGAKV